MSVRWGIHCLHFYFRYKIQSRQFAKAGLAIGLYICYLCGVYMWQATFGRTYQWPHDTVQTRTCMTLFPFQCADCCRVLVWLCREPTDLAVIHTSQLTGFLLISLENVVVVAGRLRAQCSVFRLMNDAMRDKDRKIVADIAIKRK